MDLSKQYDMLIEAIIRPPRVEYSEEDLGGTQLQLGTRHFEREDFELVNPRGLTFYCSMYRPTVRPAKLPCIIYCHGNAGCRLDAVETLRTLLPMNIMVVTFDFSGCGMSEGEYISLGYYEKDDVSVLVNHLRENNLVTRIGLWGRSMGAATSIQCAQADPSLACVVLDSPFSSLVTLAGELVTSADFSIPNIMFKIAFSVIRKSVKKRAKFDIKKLDNIKAAQEAFVPALFGHGDEDDFIRPTHTIALEEAYAGDSNKVIFGGDHNSMRPPFFHSSVTIFIRNNLLVAGDFEGDNSLPKGATIDEYFASIGGGDSMKVFPQVARRYDDDDDSTDESGDYPPMAVVGGSARNGGGVTEDDLVQQAIALSLAEQTKPIEVDDDLALALALSAAESKIDSAAANHGNGRHSDLRDSNSSVGKADSRKPGARSPPVEDAPVATTPGSSKVKKDKKEKEKKSKKDKDKKSSKDPQSSVSPATSPNPLGNPFLDEPESPVVSPRPPKDKKSKHKSPSSTSSPPLSPIASPKRSNNDDDRQRTPTSPARSPLAGSKLGRSDEPAVSLDLSDDDSMDEDMKLAIALSQQPQTPPRSKKK